MQIKGIKVIEHRKKFEIYHLKDILGLIENGEQYFWTIYDFEATFVPNSSDQSLRTYQSIINSPDDYKISWKELNAFASDLFQVINGYLLGSKDTNKLKIYFNDDEMIKSCDISIVMFDSSWWIIYTKNEPFYERLVSNFKDDELLVFEY